MVTLNAVVDTFLLSTTQAGMRTAMGAVGGPASSTDNAVVRYDGTTGKLVQNSGVAIDDSGKVSVGTNAVYGAPVAQFNGANVAITNTAGQFSIGTTDTAAADLGGSLGFTANTTTLAGYPMGSISARLVAAGAGAYESYMAFATTGAGGTVAERMRITATGNVGIGTGSPAIAAAGKNSLDVNGPILARGGVGANQTSAGGLDTSGNDLRIRSWGATAGTGSMSFRTGGGGGSVDAEAMRITYAGRVGIGDATPSYKLDVNGDAGINGDTYISAGTASRTAVAFANPVSSLCPELRMTRQGASTSTNDFIKLDTSSGEVVSIDASGGAFFAGKVGIGTASPAHKLTVSEASTDFAALITNSTSSGNGLKINAGNNSGDRVLELNDKDGTSLMRVLATGNVGIGTTSPAYQLQLSTDSAAKPSTNTWTIASDARIKTETGEYTKGLDAVLALRPVTYRYNGKAGMVDDGEDKISIIAQEAITAFPECVGSYMTKLEEDDEEDTEVLNWNGHALTFALVNAVKELTARIAALENN